MRPDKAVAALQELLESKDLGNEALFLEWRSNVSSVLRAAFGSNAVQVQEFGRVTVVKHEGYVTARGRRHDEELWRQDAATRGRALVKSAIYTLASLADESPLDHSSVDPDLWAHVQGLIADGDWAKVPAEVTIFVEDKLRTWAGDPRHSSTNSVLIGKGLYAAALNKEGQLRLGRQASETEGWLALGTGLAQAIGNVDRHRIQQRSDLRRYAMGVLGLGSLILTQIRYEHPAQVLEAEAETATEADDGASITSGGTREH